MLSTGKYNKKEKINAIATKIYGADGVDFTKEAEKEIANLEKLGYSNLQYVWQKHNIL